MLTLFQPRDGELHIKGVTSASNAVLHPWLKEPCAAILATLPAPAPCDATTQTALWHRWQPALSQPITLPKELPALRMLWVWDNLAGHCTPALIQRLIEHGIMPLDAPLGGAWLTMAESMQRSVVRRALDGQAPETPAQILEALEATARAWNREPTPTSWVLH